MKLEKLGWNRARQEEFEKYGSMGLMAGRIVRETRHIYQVESAGARFEGRISGHFEYTALRRSEYPVIGDWVAVRDTGGNAVIEAVLSRTSAFSRKTAGIETDEQIIAANIDVLLIVFGLDGGRNFSSRGLERYLTLAWEGGARAVIVLNKADLCEDPQDIVAEAESAAPGIPVKVASALTGEGVIEIAQFLPVGITGALTGPSGVGKSALINTLLEEEKQKTGRQRRSDLRGRHTTSHRELLFIPGQGMIIDTPGLREVQLWAGEESLDSTFREIADLAAACRFRNCSHTGEPHCAVQRALEEGIIDRRRFENYLDLKKELERLSANQDERERRKLKSKAKQLAKNIRSYYRNKHGKS